MQLLRCCFQRRNAYRVTDTSIGAYIMLHYLRAVSNITTVVTDADGSLHVIMLCFSCDLIVFE